MNNNSPDYVESLKNKWMTGRGTKVLYAAIVILLWCAVGSMISTGAATAKAEVAVKNSLQMAQVYTVACKDVTFYKLHEEHCLMARSVIADPTKPVSPLTAYDKDAGAASTTEQK